MDRQINLIYFPICTSLPIGKGMSKKVGLASFGDRVIAYIKKIEINLACDFTIDML